MSFVKNARSTSSTELVDKVDVTPTLSERLQNYIEPAFIHYTFVFVFFKLLLRTIIFNPSALFPFSSFRSKAFAETWLSLSGGNENVWTLKNIVPLFNSADGVILDLGPGDGRQTIYYTNKGIKAIYGAEPCEDLHSALRASVDEAGIGGKYHILNCGAQKESLIPMLTKVGLLKGKPEGVFDSIVCSKVLCSVPHQEDTIAGLYSLLKPGGRMIICEHIKNPWRTKKGSIVARAIQQLITMLGWSFFLCGCSLMRNTDQVLKSAADIDGGWEKIDFEIAFPWGAIPFVLGELVKKD